MLATRGKEVEDEMGGRVNGPAILVSSSYLPLPAGCLCITVLYACQDFAPQLRPPQQWRCIDYSKSDDDVYTSRGCIERFLERRMMVLGQEVSSGSNVQHGATRQEQDTESEVRYVMLNCITLH